MEETKFTLITALEQIWKKSHKCQLSTDFFVGIKEETDFIGDLLKINPLQSIFLSIIMDRGNATFLTQIAEHLDCSNIKMMCYEDELTELHHRRLLKWTTLYNRERNQQWGYSIHPDLLASIKENKPYQPVPLSEYTTYEVIEQIGKWLTMGRANESLADLMSSTIFEFIDDTQHLFFSRRLKELDLQESELMMLLLASWQLVINGERTLQPENYLGYLSNQARAKIMVHLMNEGFCKIMKLGLMENEMANGIVQPNSFRLTDKALKTILCEVTDFLSPDNAVGFNLLQPKSITQKELFFNERENIEIDRLAKLLSQESFSNIQKRLSDSNMRNGFTCLFYGSPGTGKTESVLQLCRETERPVVVADISELRSKWVGESEKRVQALFTQYENLAKNSKVCPILLLNEADAIICKRSTAIEHSVDKMENSCQDIMLQAMENFSGILIATTNLEGNLDSAFERRFLYKIYFEKPSIKVRAKIWQSMLPELSGQDSSHLSQLFNFSGGQIENIARKQTVDNLLYNHATTINSVQTFCQQEQIIGNQQKLGFL